jgi:hypothetical protein
MIIDETCIPVVTLPLGGRLERAWLHLPLDRSGVVETSTSSSSVGWPVAEECLAWRVHWAICSDAAAATAAATAAAVV